VTTCIAQAAAAKSSGGRSFHPCSVAAWYLVRCAAFILALALPIPRHAAAQALGMWVWPQTAYSTREARQQLIQFCVSHHIDRLDVGVRIARDNGTPAVESPEAIANLISLAEQNNIATVAVRGSPRMFSGGNNERTLSELAAIIAFNKTLPAGSSFKGVTYDVEPYLTNEWKANLTSRRAIMLAYLNTLRKLRSLLHAQAPRLRLAVAMPFWWDRDDLHIKFRGEEKPFSEHVQDATDFVVLMSYRRHAGQVLASAENEMKYARQVNKEIFLGLETNPLPRNGDISFSGLPPGRFWNVVTVLLQAARTDDAIGGIMIESYRGLRTLSSSDRNPIIPEAR
jgi:hypothetical protein